MNTSPPASLADKAYDQLVRRKTRSDLQPGSVHCEKFLMEAVVQPVLSLVKDV